MGEQLSQNGEGTMINGVPVVVCEAELCEEVRGVVIEDDNTWLVLGRSRASFHAVYRGKVVYVGSEASSELGVISEGGWKLPLKVIPLHVVIPENGLGFWSEQWLGMAGLLRTEFIGDRSVMREVANPQRREFMKVMGLLFFGAVTSFAFGQGSTMEESEADVISRMAKVSALRMLIACGRMIKEVPGLEGVVLEVGHGFSEEANLEHYLSRYGSDPLREMMRDKDLLPTLKATFKTLRISVEEFFALAIVDGIGMEYGGSAVSDEDLRSFWDYLNNNGIDMPLKRGDTLA